MITKVTKDNKVLYTALFEKATNELFGKDGEYKISTLDEYFACIGSLAEKDPIYTVLPLDEPVFSIDTNTRAITIPADFSKNGVSLQGDEVYEILYFTVDRYVDAMDLYREDIKIAIQWETAPNTNREVVQGISTEYVRDITTYSKQGKMLFGWALDSRLTKVPGNIKFSVRFYHFDAERNLDFSLNTLTATATVKPSIDYKFENGQSSVQVIDSSNLIKNRLENSVTPGTVDKEAAKPEFEINIPLASDIRETITEDERVFHVIDLDVEGDSYYYNFEAQAYAGDEGIISYSWGRADFGNKNFSSIEGSEAYVKTKDTVYSSKYNYYEVVEETEAGEPIYGLVALTSGDLGKEIDEEDRDKLYVKVGQCTVGETGDYRVVAANRLGFSTTTTESNLVRIPGPDEATFALTSETPEQVLLYGDIAGSATFKAVAGTAKKDKIAYTWFLDGVEASKEENKESNTETTFVIPDVLDANRATYDATVRVEAEASRNGDTIGPKALEFRVTDPAHEVVVEEGDTTLDIEEGKTKTLVATANAYGMVSDKVTYQWFKVVAETDDDPANDDENDIPVTDEPIQATSLIEGFEKKYLIEQTISIPGTYYCKITNHVNGSVATKKSNRFRVSPI